MCSRWMLEKGIHASGAMVGSPCGSVWERVFSPLPCDGRTFGIIQQGGPARIMRLWLPLMKA